MQHPSLNPYNFSIDGTYRTITSSSRTLPDFLLIGFPKAGTSSLFSYINEHQNIGIPSPKGRYFFSNNYWRGESWYKAHFPTVKEKIKLEKQNGAYCIGENTAYLWNHPCAKRIHDLIPNVKLIVLLRNPITSVYSHYHFRKTKDIEKMTFNESIKNDQNRLENWKFMVKNDLIRRWNRLTNIPYLSYRKYAVHLREWFKVIPQKQFLFLQTEKMSNKHEIQETVNKVFEFLNLPKQNVTDFSRKNVNKYESMTPEIRDLLKDFFKSHNKKLEKLLDMKFNWDAN